MDFKDCFTSDWDCEEKSGEDIINDFKRAIKSAKEDIGKPYIEPPWVVTPELYDYIQNNLDKEGK